MFHDVGLVCERRTASMGTVETIIHIFIMAFSTSLLLWIQNDIIRLR